MPSSGLASDPLGCLPPLLADLSDLISASMSSYHNLAVEGLPPGEAPALLLPCLGLEVALIIFLQSVYLCKARVQSWRAG